jgi:hypothetical protein
MVAQRLNSSRLSPVEPGPVQVQMYWPVLSAMLSMVALASAMWVAESIRATATDFSGTRAAERASASARA